MKNIHIIPTDKPTRIFKSEIKPFLHLYTYDARYFLTGQNIYITSDEKFIRDEYVTDGIEVIQASPKLVDAQGLVNRRGWKKIVLTTDSDLIKDGIQEISDGVIEWLVKNPSCEEVEIGKTNKLIDNYAEKEEDKWEVRYYIYIPKEIPKQDINTCKNFDRETGCDLVDCLCENQEILSEAKKRAKQETLEDIELEEVIGSRHCQFSVVENKLAIIYRNQLKILQAIKMLNNER
jgi:hypothetical protein